MTNIASKLKSLGMNVDVNFLVPFIINCLPHRYDPFQMNYNTMKDKWNVHELQSMLVQEETRLKSLHETKNFLCNNFGMKDMGEGTYVIGIKLFWDRSQELFRLSQKAYINKV